MANAKNTAITFILGVAAGAVAGILLAPDAGKNTRVKWKQAALDLKDNINTQVQDGYNKINQLKEEAISAVNKTIKKGEDVARSTASKAEQATADINS
jgi:gas vesicle protein